MILVADHKLIKDVSQDFQGIYLKLFEHKSLKIFSKTQTMSMITRHNHQSHCIASIQFYLLSVKKTSQNIGNGYKYCDVNSYEYSQQL